jgi:hypothetical protein
MAATAKFIVETIRGRRCPNGSRFSRAAHLVFTFERGETNGYLAAVIDRT